MSYGTFDLGGISPIGTLTTLDACRLLLNFASR